MLHFSFRQCASCFLSFSRSFTRSAQWVLNFSFSSFRFFITSLFCSSLFCTHSLLSCTTRANKQNRTRKKKKKKRWELISKYKLQFYPHSSFFYIWWPRSPVYFYWPLFMQVDGSYFFTGWQLWWVHICKEPINWSSCLWCCPQLFLRPTQTYPPRPGFYQLIMPVPSESNYKKPHIHTPTFLAPFPSLTIYLKVIKLGVLALKHLSQSFCMWENCMVQQGLRQFFLQACHFLCHKGWQSLK